MQTPPSTLLTRRSLLLVAPATVAVGVLSACTGEQAPPPVDPVRVALESALDAESLLLAAVSGWTFASAELGVQALGIAEQHVDVLRATLGAGPASPSASSSPTVSSAADLVRLIDDTADAHSRAIRSADAAVCPLLAALAASDATLAAAVRRDGS